MKFVLFKDLLEESADPQYGILADTEEPEVLCLCCGGTVEFGDYVVISELPWFNISELLKKEFST